MLKKWMMALGMVSILTLAACNTTDDDPEDEDRMEEQESDDTEQESDDTEEDTDDDAE
ncbi:hypothetical protein SFC66_12345 [Terribacillus saccharophilus]|uniref:hypothetical protein n=1 Tax=Terribacillus saccharophilus TaxID=361277 RepID=UPI003981CB8F